MWEAQQRDPAWLEVQAVHKIKGNRKRRAVKIVEINRVKRVEHWVEEGGEQEDWPGVQEECREVDVDKEVIWPYKTWDRLSWHRW